MKVIQLVDELDLTGGVPVFVYDLALALQKEGCEVIIIRIIEKNAEKKESYDELLAAGIKVISLGANSKINAITKHLSQLRRIIKEISHDEKTILNMHLKLSVLMGCIASAGIKNIVRIETYHNTYLHYHLQFNALRPFIKKYITVSETSRLELINQFNAPADKVLAAPNGVDREKLRKMAGPVEKHEYISIVSVGRLSYEKNFTVPVEALSSICSPSVQYTMIGDGPDREKVEAVRNGNEFITLTGSLERKDVFKHLAAADLVIMPSLWEGRSILQLEAMAFDVPLMISDVPGLREPFQENELNSGESYRRCRFGYLVRAKDKCSIREAVEDYVKNKEHVEANMRETVKAISYENDIAKTANRYFLAYCEACKPNVLTDHQ